MAQTAYRLYLDTVVNNRFIPWNMFSKQAAFLSLPCTEALYGGATRGGKTVALLAAAAQFVHVPNYSALILRKSYSDLALPKSSMDLSMKWWMQMEGPSWNGNDHRWTFPSGATISFSYLSGPDDKYRYKSSSFQYIAFDELTEHNEVDYLYLFSRMHRETGMQVPLRMRAGTNPDGPGRDWVKKRFIDSDPSVTGRVFIPARLEDNPHEDQQATERALSNLDHVTRRQLRYGDWEIRPEGGLFKRKWFKIISEQDKLLSDLQAAISKDVDMMVRCRFWDCAATEGGGAYTAGVKIARSLSGVYFIEDVVREQRGPAGVERLILSTAARDGLEVRVRMEEEGGSSGKAIVAHYTKALAGYDFQGVRATGEKSLRWRPLAVQSEAGNVYIMQGHWNDAFLEELECVPHYPYLDQSDAASGALSELALNSRPYGDYGFS